MPKQNQENAENSSDAVVQADLSVRLSLHWLRNRSTNDALFGVLSWIAKAGDCSTAPDATVKQILAPHCWVIRQPQPKPFRVKQAQTWSELLASLGWRLRKKKRNTSFRKPEPLLWHLHFVKTWRPCQNMLPLIETAFEQFSPDRALSPYWQQSRNFQRNPRLDGDHGRLGSGAMFDDLCVEVEWLNSTGGRCLSLCSTDSTIWVGILADKTR